jgi:hypothetical protein
MKKYLARLVACLGREGGRSPWPLAGWKESVGQERTIVRSILNRLAALTA